MIKLVTACCFLAVSSLSAEASLKNLIEYDKVTCLERLEIADDTELWDAFLEGQAKLFFPSEVQSIAKGAWWQQAKRILEIGSGNGAYLSKLVAQFEEKTFRGIEKLPIAVEQANEHFASPRLVFQEGDAEIFDTLLTDSTDIVLFRLTLQHLKDPVVALRNAWHYIAPEGYLLIIDSCDVARMTSHPITAIDEALCLVAECQRKNGKGNRKISLELLNILGTDKSPLTDLYDVAFTSLNTAGDVLCDFIRFEGEKERELFFNHSLLFLNLLNRTYQIPIDVDQAYDELRRYLEDEDAWTSAGMHFLVLKKKNINEA